MASYGLFWKKHNFWTFEQKQTPILIAIDRSFWVIPVSQERQGHDNMTHPIQWTPPSAQQRFKVNFDACFDQGRPTCFGMVFRDCEGHVLASALKLIPQCISPKMADILCMK